MQTAERSAPSPSPVLRQSQERSRLGSPSQSNPISWPCRILKDYSVQHLPDGSITVESILIQATAHSEDQGTKVLLVSWTYQVGIPHF